MYRERAKGWLKHVDFMLLDVLSLELSFVLAYWIRMRSAHAYARSPYRNMGLALLLIDVVVIFFSSAYTGVLRRGYFKEASRTLYQTLLILGMSSLYLFAIQEGDSYSRIVLFLTGALYLVISYLTRIGWKALIRKIRKKPGPNALLAATTAAQAEDVVRRLQCEPRRSFHIAGLVLMDGDGEALKREYLGVPVVATRQNMVSYVCRAWVDEILFVLPDMTEYKALADELAESGVAVHVSMGRAQSEIGKKQIVEQLGGYTVMTTTLNCVTFRQAFFKRAFDIAAGLAGSVIALLALLIVGPIIYIQSPGPILFKQVRVGRNGRKFNFLKIRSMVIGADAMKKDLMEQNRVKDGMMFKLDFDPRIIGAKKLPDGTIKRGIGNFIRDWSIDELPQFFNVLKGDMSLVGTRPPTVDEWEKYQLHHRARLAFKPGITGLWQVSGRSNITDFEEVVRLDTKYINEWDFGMDCRIIADTFKTVIKKTGSM